MGTLNPGGHKIGVKPAFLSLEGLGKLVSPLLSGLSDLELGVIPAGESRDNTPSRGVIPTTEWGYAGTDQPGVYRSQERSLRLITLLSLNDLSAAPHNAFIKTFASRRQQKREAFATLKRTGLSWLTVKLPWFLAGLQSYWFSTDTGEDFMKQQLTPEKVMALGEQWILACLATLPVEKRLEFVGLTAQERLAGLPASELVAKLSVQERLAGLTPQEVFSQWTPEEIENYLRQLPH